MKRKHVIWDGFQDPLKAQLLSAHWTAAGFSNVADIAGQTAWLRTENADHADRSSHAALTEKDMHRAAAVARAYGLIIRDRPGRSFRADNDLAAMRRQMAYEYKSRFVTAMVFGLPALVLHYTGEVLAGGVEGDGGAKWMLYPWLFELLLVGWVCVAAGWPILCQGVTSCVHLRFTADLLTSLLVAAAFVPSSIGVLSLGFSEQPWFVSNLGSGSPAFHAAWVAISLAVLQRWWMYSGIEHISGRADLMLPSVGKLFLIWFVLSALVMIVGGWWLGLAFGLIMPPMVSCGAINPWSPGRSSLLPVFGFAAILLIGPRALGLSLEGVEIEAAGGFCLAVSVFFAVGWQRFPTSGN